MLALVNGKTLVKGVSNKEVDYFGTAQEDGYIYFNDGRFYRARAESELSPTEDVELENVQIWYPDRQAWIRSNVFTDLKAKGLDIDDMLNQIQQAVDDAIQAIQDAADAATDILDVNSKMLHNGTALLHTANTLNQVITVVNAQHQQSIQPITDTIWTDAN